MKNLLRLSSIQALLPGLVMLAVPAGASAQPRMMGARMGGPGMARPAGSAAMAQPSRMSPTMAPAMQPMSAGGGRTSGMGYGSSGMAPNDMQAYGAAGASTDPQGYAAEAQPSAGEKSTSSLLTASGVPNDKGQLRWPIGLAILAAPGADELCEQIDGLFAEAARQAAGGPVNPAVTEEVQREVKELRRLLLQGEGGTLRDAVGRLPGVRAFPRQAGSRGPAPSDGHGDAGRATSVDTGLVNV
jgi:hypothetical protein